MLGWRHIELCIHYDLSTFSTYSTYILTRIWCTCSGLNIIAEAAAAAAAAPAPAPSLPAQQAMQPPTSTAPAYVHAAAAYGTVSADSMATATPVAPAAISQPYAMQGMQQRLQTEDVSSSLLLASPTPQPASAQQLGEPCIKHLPVCTRVCPCGCMCVCAHACSAMLWFPYFNVVA